MRSTWYVILTLMISFVGTVLMTGCGQKTPTNIGGDDTQAKAPLPAEPNPVEPEQPIVPEPDLECVISSLTALVDPACTRIVFGTTPLADRTIGSNSVQLIASKKNGGSGGSRWFDSRVTLVDKPNLLLPNSIAAEGNAGNGQKLYAIFNNEIDCAWYSYAKNQYRLPRCFQGATRDASTSTGFIGGEEVAADEISEVVTISLTVSGAAGGGVLTTATAEFTRR